MHADLSRPGSIISILVQTDFGEINLKVVVTGGRGTRTRDKVVRNDIVGESSSSVGGSVRGLVVVDNVVDELVVVF